MENYLYDAVMFVLPAKLDCTNKQVYKCAWSVPRKNESKRLYSFTFDLAPNFFLLKF